MLMVGKSSYNVNLTTQQSKRKRKSKFINHSLGVEMGVDWLCERISRMCGKAAPKDPEDPAALVGSFKRYK